jgi:hypothetical protein
MAAILVPKALRQPDVSHAVTVSIGVRIAQPGWNDMKPESMAFKRTENPASWRLPGGIS